MGKINAACKGSRTTRKVCTLGNNERIIMLGVVIQATTFLLQNLVIIISSTEFLSFCTLLIVFTSRHSKRILQPISNFAKQTTIGKTTFKLLASISISPWKWWFAGKASEAAGVIITEANTTILGINTTYVGKAITLTGSSASVPASFLISQKISQYRFFWQSYNSFTHKPIRIIPKSIQGGLLTFTPFILAKKLYTQEDPLNFTLNALDKTKKFGIRDSIEYGLEQTLPPELKTANKCFALLVTEQSIAKTTKVAIREYYEQLMLKEWTDSCPTLEKQIPFMISNIVYAFSIDPTFTTLQQQEEIATNHIKNLIERNNNTEESMQSEDTSAINTDYLCTCSALTGYEQCIPT